MNNVSLVGRLTADPIYRTSHELAIVAFTLAVNRPKRKNQQEQQADFITCKAFNTTATYIANYIKKGYLVTISGNIRTGQYQGQDGQIHYTTDVIIESIENLTGKPQQQSTQQQNYQVQNNQNDYTDDDLPF